LEHFEFSLFPLASSPAELTGKYDAALVEGCISMPHERELLLALRKRSVLMIALGTCAVWGGVAALRNDDDRELLRHQVYGKSSVGNTSAKPLPIESLVQIDSVITGCPPEKRELLRLLAGLLRGVLPAVIDYTVCSECRMRENLCLLTERDELCLGPLTLGGCTARCPSLSVPCEGCRGPVPEANLKESLEIYAQRGFDQKTVLGRLHRFCPEWKV
jgi:coenzyme F420-reducing hydrogenase gamma subunit